MDQTATAAAPEPTTEQPAKSANMTLAQLGERMSKGRKALSPAKPAKAPEATATPTTSSEQADDGEAEVDLSNLETDSSAALADDASAEEVAPKAKSPEGDVETDPEPSKGVRDLQKRVGKVTEQRNAARDEVADLKAQVEEMRAKLGKSPQPVEAHPSDESHGGDRMVSELDSTLTGVDAFLAWADENPDGGSFTEGGKDFELTGEEVRLYRRKSVAELSRLNAKREARLETLRGDFDTKRAAAHAEAVRLYPWVEQKGSAEFQEALAVIRSNPDVLKRSDFELVVARQVVGQRLEQEALKRVGHRPGSKPAMGRAATPVVTFSPTATPKGNKSATSVSAAENQFRNGGGRESDLSKLLAQKRIARLQSV